MQLAKCSSINSMIDTAELISSSEINLIPIILQKSVGKSRYFALFEIRSSQFSR